MLPSGIAFVTRRTSEMRWLRSQARQRATLDWTTGHLGEASMTLLSSRREGGRWGCRVGIIGVRTLYILSREARVLAAVLRLIGYTRTELLG
jgi:hypothetical protein